jgi:uncharacterized membrane protein
MTGRTVAGTRRGARDGSGWAVPVALCVLSIIPLVAGSLRLVEVAGGPRLLPDNPRIDAVPAPVVVHILSAAFFALLGAFQFSGRLRRRRPAWHRRTGRLLVGAGLLVALSGLWMTLFYPGAPGGDLLWAIRLVIASAMAGCLALGFTTIRRHDVPAHRAWMVRAYALGLGAATQMLTNGVGEAFFGTGNLSIALSMGSGWALNIAVAEWVLHRPTGRPVSRPRPRSALAESR